MVFHHYKRHYSLLSLLPYLEGTFAVLNLGNLSFMYPVQSLMTGLPRLSVVLAKSIVDANLQHR